jgi:hypothetical protein
MAKFGSLAVAPFKYCEGTMKLKCLPEDEQRELRELLEDADIP